MDIKDLPTSLVERVNMMEGILIASATGGSKDGWVYEYLRREFTQNTSISGLLPKFVRTHRTLTAFWPYIKEQAPTYAERRKIISDAFNPLVDYLEGKNSAPGDQAASDALQSFDVEGVHVVWEKAISRRTSDPEGAITMARTLLETVCKHILDKSEEKYTGHDDLPKLYGKVARLLKLAPDQHVEEPIKAILGGGMTMVNGIGTLRNRYSDAHGTGVKAPVRPSPRHASFAVNTAGAIATFLVETLNDRS